MDQGTTGKPNCIGTTILIRRNIPHNYIIIPTKSIENTIIHTTLNGKELRLYKIPSLNSCNNNFNSLLNSDSKIILAGDLNAKKSYMAQLYYK